jgi:sigma-54 dependent transcriptional regulator, acetoin dehydrogenase operon transcriptional activator AcoR
MLAATQREHINRVLSAADGIQNERDPILRSWSRCMKDYGLDPARSAPAQVIEQARLREHQSQIDEFMKIARTGMERLYARVVDDGYVVLFTNAQGITVDFVGDLKNADLKRAGLYLAADWGEERAGTCGVGTCIVEKAPISCHQTDHFNSTHLSLTCNSAPLFDPSGDLLGVLDISALTSPAPRESQHLALQMTTLYAGLIEDANFLHVFRDRWILRLSSAWSMVEVATEIMFAFDADGVIFGMNTGARRAFRLRRLSFAGDRLADPVGQDIGGLFHEGMNGVWRLANPRTSADRGALRTRSGEILFGSVSTPHAASRPAHRASPQLPDVAALAALAGDDPTMSRLIDQAKRIVDKHVNVLILGETGTGKEVLTRAMHASGARSKQPFVAVNCAAIPEALIESELFGYAPGSFTGGRHKGKSGLILEANGGTLFLDEIGDMPLHLQTRLLRVLSANEVLILGETKPTSIDIRLIAASNQDLQELISKGRFRQDLYYRLCGATLRLPSLRERKDWSFLLDKIFREEAAQANSTARLGPAAADLLQRYTWPGNIRQLRNVLRLSLAMNSGRSIEPSDLPDEITGGKDDAVPGTVRGASPGKPARLSSPESQARGAKSARLRDALERANWNIPNAASHLGVCRATVYRRMKQNAIVPPNKTS